MATKIHQTIRSERALRGGGRRLDVEFHSGGGDPIPGILLLPEAAKSGGVLLLHGYSSRREHMADGVGESLLRHGLASLSIDLPLHGSRHDPLQLQAARNPLAVFGLWRQAVRECRLAFNYLGARPEVDRGCMGVAGYSLGSFLAVMLGADEPGVRAVCLAAGGDLPSETPLAAVARAFADPLRAVRKLDGRPLLMVHGKNDRTVTPAQARRLFEAAHEPKELRWWNAGHRLPPDAIDYAAEWLVAQLGRPKAQRATG
ncbi:MAG TPA: dienelactone hydrolase family protein [Longimicrobium sp.]|nr:dienelactone hydrolase family protein [Longimicrobium sp.]